MPHQCLSCGYAFEEGSSALLKGCPDCKGTRFFYTAEAVPAAERKAIAADAQKDLRQVVTDMLSEASPEARKTLEANQGEDGWATLKPKDLRKLVKQVQADSKKQGSAPLVDGPRKSNVKPDPEAIARAADLKAQRARVEAEIAQGIEEKPDTVSVGDGAYDINVKGLLEKNPIVVQKDGAYMIHLPSLFQNRDS